MKKCKKNINMKEVVRSFTSKTAYFPTKSFR